MDVIIRNGRIIDPANDVNCVGDVAIKAGRIAAIGSGINSTAKEEFDATGCLVTPGLIDLHIHGYQYATPLGINVDEACLSRGVTTVVDAGSAGSCTFPGLRKYVVEPSNTRVLAFLHIAMHGMAAAGCSGFGAGGECDSLNQVDVKSCVDCVEKNRDLIVGIKIRLSADLARNGEYEEEAYRRALEASKIVGLPLMTHHTYSSIPFESQDSERLSCPGSLQAGDIYTHAIHKSPTCIIDSDTSAIRDAFKDAKKRGVVFDLGHGQGSFSWDNVEICAKEGFWPDVVSTDLHTGSEVGPAYDLPVVMTKMLHAGMPLVEVIRSVTATPAGILKRSDLIGSLTVGNVADVTILREESCDIDLEDCNSNVRKVKKRLIPAGVWKDGIQYPLTLPNPFPNPATRLTAARMMVEVKKE